MRGLPLASRRQVKEIRWCPLGGTAVEVNDANPDPRVGCVATPYSVDVTFMQRNFTDWKR
jgi:hypothetical protein